MKALYYNLAAKLKYDLLAVLISFLGLGIGLAMGILLTPYLLILFFLGPILAAVYQLGLIVKLENVEIRVDHDKIRLIFRNKTELYIDLALLKSVEAKRKQNFSGQYSILLTLYTLSDKYELMLIGFSAATNLLNLLDQLVEKTDFTFVDHDQIFLKKN